MTIMKLFFVPLFFSICLVAVNGTGNPKTGQGKVENSKTVSSSLTTFFKGEIKQNLEELFRVESDYLKRQDKVDEVKGKLEETKKILSYKKTFFEKEKEAGIQRQEYITKLKTAYEKWEKLNQDLEDWTRIKESLPTERWADVERGPRVLQKILNTKSQIETQMREVEAEHNVYASRKNQLEKGGDTLQQTHDKVKQETLSKLQSTIENLTAQQKTLSDKLRTFETSRQKQLGITAKSWIEDKTEDHQLDMLVWRTTKTFTPKEDTGKLGGRPDPAKLKEDLSNKFEKITDTLVEQYEEKINGMMKGQDDHNSKIRQELVHDRIQFSKKENYLDETKYSLRNLKRSENSLQQENALIDVIATILKHDPKDFNKKFAEKLMAKAKLVKAITASSSACKRTINSAISGVVTSSASRFENEVLAAIRNPVSTTLERDFVTKQVKKLTEKHTRIFQKMMDYFSDMELCAQTLHKIDNTVAKVDQWKRRMTR